MSVSLALHEEDLPRPNGYEIKRRSGTRGTQHHEALGFQDVAGSVLKLATTLIVPLAWSGLFHREIPFIREIRS